MRTGNENRSYLEKKENLEKKLIDDAEKKEKDNLHPVERCCNPFLQCVLRICGLNCTHPSMSVFYQIFHKLDIFRLAPKLNRFYHTSLHKSYRIESRIRS